MKMTMARTTAVCVASGLCLILGVFHGQAATPLMEFTFDETGTTAGNSGSVAVNLDMKDFSNTLTDLHGSGGSGVSGLTTDRAFDNTASVSVGGDGGLAIQQNAHAPDATQLGGLRSFTIMGWVKAMNPSVTAQGRLVRLIDGSSKGFDLVVETDRTLTLYINSVGLGLGSCARMTNDTWTSFAVTWDGYSGTGNTKLYLGTPTNMTLATTATHTQTACSNSAATFYVGNVYGRNRAFDGWVDNIRLFGSTNDSSGVLSRFEIDQYRNVEAVIPVASPRQGTTFLAHYDTSLDADFSKGVKTGTSYSAALTNAGTRFGIGALNLTTPSRVEYATAGNLPTSQGTVEFWIKPSNLVGNYTTNLHTFVQSYDGINQFVVRCGDAAGGYLTAFVVTNGVNIGTPASYPLTWTNEVWHHVAVSWGSGGMRLFGDGILMGTHAYAGPLYVAPAFRVGGVVGWGSDTRAVIDEFRILDTQLTAGQVLYDYQTTQPFTVPAGTVMIVR